MAKWVNERKKKITILSMQTQIQQKGGQILLAGLLSICRFM